MQIKGSELKISPAGFSDALALEKAIGRALKGTRLELPETATAEISPDMFSDIAGALLGVATVVGHVMNVVETIYARCGEAKREEGHQARQQRPRVEQGASKQHRSEHKEVLDPLGGAYQPYQRFQHSHFCRGAKMWFSHVGVR